MSSSSASSRRPRYTVDPSGKTINAQLDTADYIELLIRAGITDASRWPPGMEQGAAALQRIREIEAACAAQHGLWDWELLPPALQDEYDSAGGILDEMCDDGVRVAWDALKQRNPSLSR